MTTPKKKANQSDAQYNETLIKHIDTLNESHSKELNDKDEAHKTELEAKDQEITDLKEAHKTELEAKDSKIQELEASISEKAEETAAKIKELKEAAPVKTVDGSFEFEGTEYSFKDGFINTRIPAHLGPYTVKVDGEDKNFAGKDVIPSELALKVPALMEYLIEIGYGGLQEV